MSCKYCECGHPILSLPTTMKEGFFGAKEVPNIEQYTCPKCGTIYKLKGYKGNTDVLGIVGKRIETHISNINSTNLKLITKDEYILQRTTGKLPCKKEHANKMFDEISKGHNFIFQSDKNYYWSVDAIDELLNR